MLLSSLGACTGITLKMYANRKNWELEEVLIHLSHDKIYAEDCRECETETDKTDKIERKIKLKSKLDDKQTTFDGNSIPLFRAQDFAVGDPG